MRLPGQFLRFALVGSMATLLQYAVLYALVQLARADPVVASAIGYTLSAVANYALNYSYTFDSNASHGSAAVKFMTIALLGLALNSLVMKWLIYCGLHYLAAQIVATVTVLCWNFAGGRYWTFRDRAMRTKGDS